MPAETLSFPVRRRFALPAGLGVRLLLVVLSLQYAASAVSIAARAPLWMDEVLSVWTAREGGPSAIWTALRRGSEFSPPLYDLLLSLMGHMGVSSALGLRLPSIVAIYVAALTIGAIARRHLGPVPAVVAAGVMLSSGLFGYAVQARPYALVTAVFALALFIYDRPGRPSWFRAAGLFSLLAIAIGLHFYAMILVGALALIELVRAGGELRPPCVRTMASVAIAAASILLWHPILLAAAHFSSGDTTAPAYYARPTINALVGTYAMLLGALLAALLALLTIAAARTGRAVPDRDLVAMAIVLLAAPLLVWVFAVVVSHSYADRYGLIGAGGIALLFADRISRLGRRAEPAAQLLLGLIVLGNLIRDPGEIGKADRREALAMAEAAPGTLPIVTGSGLRYVEIAENASSAIARRLVYLDLPGVTSADPTNRHQVLRWQAIRARPGILTAPTFVCTTPAFLLLAQPAGGGADDLPGWLAQRARFKLPPSDHASLTLVRPLPCRSRQSR